MAGVKGWMWLDWPGQKAYSGAICVIKAGKVEKLFN